MRRPLLLLLGFLTLVAGVAPASMVLPAAAQHSPVLLEGGTVHTVSDAVLADTDVLIIDGRIAQIGRRLVAPPGTQVVDVTGRRIYPGLIAAHTTLGLSEIGGVRQSDDTAELGAINPNIRAQVAINPDSERIPVARSNGVLTALVAPLVASDPPGLIAGVSALVRLDGWTWEDMTLRDAVALHVFWPSMGVDHGPHSEPNPLDQQQRIDAQIDSIKDAFRSARAYQRAKEHGARPVDVDLRWEAMIPVLQGRMPVCVHANDAQQINAALDWAAEAGLKLILVGGREAWRAADRLKAADVPVILTETSELPRRRDDGYDEAFTTAARLHATGVRFSIAVSGWTAVRGNDRHLPYDAALAAAFGLPYDEALKAVTLYPAQILGVGDELGSIESGKRATLIVTDGDPLEITTRIELAFIDGAQIDLSNRQTTLYEKYRRRPVVPAIDHRLPR